MTNKQALQLAIKALEQVQKPLHVDANFHEQQGADYPLAVSASEQRHKLREAQAVLSNLIVQEDTRIEIARREREEGRQK